TAYHQFCKNEPITNPVVDIGQVIDFYNTAASDLPDPKVLKGKKLPSLTAVLDGGGQNYADVFQPGNRRIWVPLADVPDYVQKAFIAAEDRRFYEHHGVDERGIIRAFIGDMGAKGRPQGGSTITQQVVKNLLVGEEVSYERKIREMIVASRLETTLSKNEILELYMNSAYLGRGSWGVEMAAHSYFGKAAKDLTPAQGALLAGLLKGPNFYNPDRHPDRAKERLAYVLGRMQDDGVITATQKDQALATPPKPIAFTLPHRDTGFNFVDFVGHEAKNDGITDLTADSYTVHSTINAQLQRDTEAALQEGLARYEMSMGRVQFRGPETSIGDAIQNIQNKTTTDPSGAPAWQQALQNTRLPLYDMHWTPVVVLQKVQNGDALRVGLPDGRIAPLTGVSAQIRRSLNLYDVVYANIVESKVSEARRAEPKNTKNSVKNAANPTQPPKPVTSGAIAQLRVRPTVEGSALVLENRTGRILAMAGSFSYPMSQLNRVVQSARQPGSAMKPLTYLTALQAGLQPNTLVPNSSITYPPIGSGNGRDIAREYGARAEDYWSPRNFGHEEGGVFTLRRGLENSVNIVTAHLLDGGIDSDPAKSLDAICATAMAAKIYSQCVRYYPFILGAQPVRMIDLAPFYAAVANEGQLPTPHGIDSIEQHGKTIYQYPSAPLPRIGAADAASFYQLKTILQGVVARGTARAIGGLSPYVAGKTGTTEDAVDGWFIGFTNDVTVAVWVGYDNGDGKRRSLGSNETGARVALPIFQPIIEDIWARHIAPKAPLAGPSPEAKSNLVDVAIDYWSGNRIGARNNGYRDSDGDSNGFWGSSNTVANANTNSGNAFIEHFKRGTDGQVADTQYQLTSREDSYASNGYESQQPQEDTQDNWFFNLFGGNRWGNQGGAGGGRTYYPNQGWQAQRQAPQQPQQRGLFQPWTWGDNPQPAPQPARRSQSYYNGRNNY
ncbi:MAG TPA: transglycosylase domain-containing protein, partial [Xanthobacteraceae bacterium]|nr:transglycosylase domain-containing protein [Xanthobacteraceae bacterium]